MVHRGGRRGEQETVERERGKATLHVPAHNNRKGTLRAPGRDGLVRQASAGVIVYNEGNMKKNILIGHPTLGSKGGLHRPSPPPRSLQPTLSIISAMLKSFFSPERA
jgi:hypothetical protein